SVVDQQQYGPYSAEQLQEFAANGSVTPNTLVWTQSLEDWIPASGVEGLFPDQSAPERRPTLLTGAAAQAAHPLGATTPVTPAPHAYQQVVQPGYQQPVQQQPVQPGAATAAPAAAQMGGLAPQPVPPGQDYPAPGPMKASFAWLVILAGLSVVCLVVSGILAAGRIAAAFSKGGPASLDSVAEAFGQSILIIGGGMFLGIGCLLIYRILMLIYLYRAWKALQWGTNVSTSPGRAVGFLFIPFFNLYWLFVAFLGLAKDWNRVMSSHPNLAQAPRLSPRISVTYCILAVTILPMGLFTNATTSEDGSSPFAMILLGLMVTTALFELIVYGGICKAIRFMGNFHLVHLHQQASGLRLY
nr:DUF4339 domain-containing protein [Akkermansiaceae bacterium]